MIKKPPSNNKEGDDEICKLRLSFGASIFSVKGILIQKLLDFLLQMIERFSAEELPKSDFQTVAEFLYRVDA